MTHTGGHTNGSPQMTTNRTERVDPVPPVEYGPEHLGRFLGWLSAAAVFFAGVQFSAALATHAARVAITGAATAMVVPFGLAARRALGRGRVETAIALAWIPPIVAVTLATLLVPEVDVLAPFALVVVLFVLPVLPERSLLRVFAGVLAWAVALAIARGFVEPADFLPTWYTRPVEVSVLATLTGLSMFLLRDFHRRLMAVVRKARAAETRYRTLIEQLPAVTFIDELVSPSPYETRPVYISPQAEQMYGYPVGRWLEEPDLWQRILHPDDRDRVLAGASQASERGEPFEIEYRALAADGHVVWVQEASVLIPGTDGHPPVWQGVLFDVTAQREAEEERNRGFELLRHADRQRRRLLAQLVSAQEAERKRMATAIHDDPVQKMTAVGIRLGSLLRTLSDPAHVRIVEQLQETVELSIARLRALMFELRPPALDRGGLVAAVRDLVAEMNGTLPKPTIQDELSSEPHEEIRLVAYRIAVEALTNVQRHARASHVQVLFDERDGGLLLRVRDDGVGIPQDALGGERAGHLGLASIRERAEAAGGWSRIEPAQNGGTVVEAWLPMAAG